MKRTLLLSAVLLVFLQTAVFAVGMGDLKIHSYLNQPFRAEIPLVDLNNIPLSGLKASVATYEDFERMGFTYQEVLTLLKFKITKNKKGEPIIQIRSRERISDPYIELVIDLTWANGQLYRAYTILLDPPNYTLATRSRTFTTVAHGSRRSTSRGVVNKSVYQDVVVQSEIESKDRPASKYGPTTGKETIWAIAQRYVTGGVSIQQVALAIVGANPQAFEKGNLNGLKAGKRLLIPATKDIAGIPESLANAEVSAHDRAWADKTPIEHVLKPPYIDGVVAAPIKKPELEITQPSRVPVLEAPKPVSDKTESLESGALEEQTPGKVAAERPGMPAGSGSGLFSILQSPDNILPAIAGEPKAAEVKDAAVAEQKQPASSALHSVKPVLDKKQQASPEETRNFEKQISLLQSNNQRLEDSMRQREKEIQQLREQINLLLQQRKGIAGQSASASQAEGETSWLFIMVLLLIILGGVGAALYYFYHRSIGNSKPMDIGGTDDEPSPPDEGPESLSTEASDANEATSGLMTTEMGASTAVEEIPQLIEEPDDEKEELPSLPKDSNHESKAEYADEELSAAEEVIISTEDPDTIGHDEPEVPIFEEPVTPASSEKDITLPEPPATEEPKPYKRPLSDLVKMAAGTQTPVPVPSPTDNKEVEAEQDEISSTEETEEQEPPYSEHHDEHVLEFETVSLEDNENKPESSKSEANESEEDNLLEYTRDNLSDLNKEHIAEDESEKPQEFSTDSAKESESTDMEHADSDEKNVEEDEDAVIEFDITEAFADTENKKDTESAATAEDEIEPIPSPLELPSEEEDSDEIVEEKEESDKEPSEPVNEFSLEDLEIEEPPSTSEDSLVSDDENTSAAEPAQDLEIEHSEDTFADNKMVKSKTALDTLLSLAETYIGMGDIESARQSLDEVMEYGNKSQKEAARKLLEQLRY